MLCTAEGAGTGALTGSLAVAAPGCNNNFDIWSVGSRMLYIGVDFLYQHLIQRRCPAMS